MTNHACTSGDGFWQQHEKVNQTGRYLLDQFPPRGLVLLLPVKFETGGQFFQCGQRRMTRKWWNCSGWGSACGKGWVSVWFLCQIRLGPRKSVACSLWPFELSCENEYRQAQAKCWQLLEGGSAPVCWTPLSWLSSLRCAISFPLERHFSRRDCSHKPVFSRSTRTGPSFPWDLSLDEQKAWKGRPFSVSSFVSPGK